MKSDEIFKASAQVMKGLLGARGVAEAITRAQGRGAESNKTLIDRYREQINDLVRAILDAGDPGRMLENATQELKDAMVVRYLRNRELFLQTFPDGIEGIDPDPGAIWAAIMISPQDESSPSA